MRNVEAVQQMIDWMEENFENNPSLRLLALVLFLYVSRHSRNDLKILYDQKAIISYCRRNPGYR